MSVRAAKVAGVVGASNTEASHSKGEMRDRRAGTCTFATTAGKGSSSGFLVRWYVLLSICLTEGN
jgi:hypothetical protein